MAHAVIPSWNECLLVCESAMETCVLYLVIRRENHPPEDFVIPVRVLQVGLLLRLRVVTVSARILGYSTAMVQYTTRIRLTKWNKMPYGSRWIFQFVFQLRIGTDEDRLDT